MPERVTRTQLIAYGRFLVGRAKAEKQPLALFWREDRPFVFRAGSLAAARFLFRFPSAYIGTYNDAADPGHIADDLQAARSPSNDDA